MSFWGKAPKDKGEQVEIRDDLFQIGDFTLHSGSKSNFKIECDSLTDGDLETFALLISQKVKFCHVIGIPRGGKRLAAALEKYTDPEARTCLIVDDVLTTGNSFETCKKCLIEESPCGQSIVGVVLFARNECPDWIIPVFQMWKEGLG